jgi:hypothetical protein
MDKVITQSTANLLSQYIDLANEHGWDSLLLFWFRLRNFRNRDLQKLIVSTRKIKQFLATNTILPKEYVQDLVKEIETGEVKTPSTESME